MFGKKAKNNRFVMKYSQIVGDVKTVMIIVDTETGVNYITSEGESAPITPLLDSEGKPVIEVQQTAQEPVAETQQTEQVQQ